MQLYKLTFPNGKSYIGITSCTLKRRLSLHKSHARTGERKYAIQSAILKYGEDNFKAETLVIADNIEYLHELEIKAIKAFNTAVPNGYNVALGGLSPTLGRKMSQSQKEHQSKIRKEVAKIQNGLPGHIGNKATLGYKYTSDALKKISNAGCGAIFSEERRAKIGATKIGNKFGVGKRTEEQKARMSTAQKGRTFSPETLEKMSKAKKGKPWSAARRAAQEKKVNQN